MKSSQLIYNTYAEKCFKPHFFFKCWKANLRTPSKTSTVTTKNTDSFLKKCHTGKPVMVFSSDLSNILEAIMRRLIKNGATPAFEVPPADYRKLWLSERNLGEDLLSEPLHKKAENEKRRHFCSCSFGVSQHFSVILKSLTAKMLKRYTFKDLVTNDLTSFDPKDVANYITCCWYVPLISIKTKKVQKINCSAMWWLEQQWKTALL